MSSAEQAIRATVTPGQRLPTPTGRAEFEVGAIERDAIVLLLGAGRWRTRIPFAVLDEVVDSLSTSRWTLVGAVHTMESADGTIEAIVKPATRRSAGNYVAALLEHAGLVEVVLRPMRVRLHASR
jgi:hypothetical protein